MMKIEIVNEEMIDHRNRAAQGLSPPQRQMGRRPASQIVSQQWTQAGHTVAPTSGQALSTTILNAVPILAYENIGPSTSNPARTLDDPQPLEIGPRKCDPIATFITIIAMIQVTVEG